MRIEVVKFKYMGGVGGGGVKYIGRGGVEGGYRLRESEAAGRTRLGISKYFFYSY